MRFLFLVKGVKGSWKKNVPFVFCSLIKVGRSRGLSCCSSGLFSVTSAKCVKPSAGTTLKGGIHSMVVWETIFNLMVYSFISGQLKCDTEEVVESPCRFLQRPFAGRVERRGRRGRKSDGK